MNKKFEQERGIKMRAKKGFTLIEILIVVVILGILAAVVIPQFTDASTDAKFSSLKSNLQTVRSQIQLYKINNLDTPPTLAGFTAAMVPTYLQKVPDNPFSGGNTLAADTSGDWQYIEATGIFTAADGGTTDGVAHSSL